MSYKDDFFDFIDDNRYEEARMLLENNKTFANEDPFYYLNMGLLLTDMERYQEAEVYLLKGVHAFPEHGEMHFRLAFCYYEQNLMEEALHEYIEAQQLDFGEGFIQGEIGNCYRALGQYKQALYCYEDVLMDQPNNPIYIAYAGNCYDVLGKRDDALAYYLKSYHLDPNDDACFDLANFYNREGNYEEEIKYLKQIKASENQTWKYYHIASAYVYLQQPENALVYLLKLKDEGSDDTNLHSLFGDVYAQLQDFKKSKKHYDLALQYYEHALTKEEEHTWIYQEMIWIAHKQKDWNKKLALLKRADKEKPNDLWLAHHFATCYSALGQSEDACRACEFCMKQGDTGKDMCDLYSWNLGLCNRAKEAIDVLVYRKEHYGEDRWMNMEFGRNYMLIEKYLQAIEYFKKACNKQDDDDGYCLGMIGACYYEVKEYQKAYQFLKDSLAKGYQDGYIFYYLGETLTHLHRKVEALEAFEKAFALNYETETVMRKIMILKNELYDD